MPLDVYGAVQACWRAARSRQVRTLCSARGLSADDAVQDVLLRSLETQRGVLFVEPGQRARYASRAVKWAALSESRRVRRHPVVSLDDRLVDDGPTTERIVYAREQVAHLLVAESRGSSALALAIAGTSYSRQARAEGVSPSTITRRRDAWLRMRKVQPDLFFDWCAKPASLTTNTQQGVRR